MVEFISYCTTVPGDDGKPVIAVQRYIDFNNQKFEAILNQLLPDGKSSPVQR